MSVGEYTCNSQTTSEGSESTLLVAFLHGPFVPFVLYHRLTTERKSPVKCRETQLSFKVDFDVSCSCDFSYQAL